MGCCAVCRAKTLEKINVVFGAERHKFGPTGCISFDMEKSAHRVARSHSAMLARPTTNSRLACFSARAGDRHGHVYTPRELHFAMGWPTISTTSSDVWKAAVDSCIDMDGLSDRDRRIMLGGSIHLPMLLSWLMFVHSHVCRREHLLAFQPTPRPNVCIRWTKQYVEAAAAAGQAAAEAPEEVVRGCTSSAG